MQLRTVGAMAVLGGVCGAVLYGGGVLGGSTAEAAPGDGGLTYWEPSDPADGDGASAQVPVARFDPTGRGGFFDAPWPSDARRTPRGAPDLAGAPNPRGIRFLDATYDLASQDPTGFSPSGTVYLPFSGPVRVLRDDPLATLADDCPVWLVDVDPDSPEYLQRRPFHCGLTTVADGFRPAHLLQLLPVPGFALRSDTTYAAVVLKSLGSTDGAPLDGNPVVEQLLRGETPPGAQPRWTESFAPLRRALPELGLEVDDVAVATVFTTYDPTAELRAWVRAVEERAGPEVLSLEVRDRYDDFTALVGTYRVPRYQEGVPPYFVNGELQVDADGVPIPQGWDIAEFQVSIPHGDMPEAGYPLYFYVHGTGGTASQAIDRGRRPSAGEASPRGSGIASYAAPLGWGTACAALTSSPTRIGGTSLGGYARYNPMNPVGMRDSFRQMILELVRFRALVSGLEIDPDLVPQAQSRGPLRFDGECMVVGGQSMGSYLSGMLASVTDGWKGAVLTGAGGSWVEFAFGPVVPVKLQEVLEFLVLPPGERLDRFHPLLMAFDLAGGPADNTHYLRSIYRTAAPGASPPHMLVIEGYRDLQISTRLQRALMLAWGVDYLGPAVGEDDGDLLRPTVAWGGRQALDESACENVVLADGSARTAVLVRYPEDGILEGHHVAFQLDAPKAQIADLLRDLSAGVAPTVRVR